jgi:hypothetical protein
MERFFAELVKLALVVQKRAVAHGATYDLDRSNKDHVIGGHDFLLRPTAKVSHSAPNDGSTIQRFPGAITMFLAELGCPGPRAKLRQLRLLTTHIRRLEFQAREI